MVFERLALALAAGLALVFVSPVAVSNTPEQIFDQVSPAVVVVVISDATGKSAGLGSGVVIAEGQVITNCHVAQKGEALQVRHSGKVFKATLQLADPDRDLCQLHAPDLKVSPVTLGTAKKLKVGQRVYAIGAPLGLELTLSEGLVSSLRPYDGSQYIQTSAAISPGSSGGGLFDEQGRLIGITTFYIADGQNLNFALPVDWIGELPKRAQASELKNKGSALDWYNHAVLLEQKKDWQGLLTHMQKWVKSEPRNAVAQYNLGIAYERLDRHWYAIGAYLKAIKIEPERAEIWNQLGNAFNSLEQYDQSIKAYRESLRIDPDYSRSWASVGYMYLLHFRRYDKAIESFREVLRIEPADADVWQSLARAYSLSSQTDKAIQAMQEALRIEPENANRWKMLASYYVSDAQLEKAVITYQEALRIQAEDADAWKGLAGAHKYLSQFDQAIRAYREALRIKPEEADFWWGLADTFRAVKQYDKAVEAYQEALRIEPDFANVWNDLGYTYFQLGQRDKVREVYQTLRKLSPATADKYFNDLLLP